MDYCQLCFRCLAGGFAVLLFFYWLGDMAARRRERDD